MSAEETAPQAIRTRPVPNCAVCGAAGEPLYDDLEDRLFGAPGRWRMVRCPECEMLWLDPAPIAEDLGLAYARYYTHAGGTPERSRLRVAIRRAAIQGYAYQRFGYLVPGWWWKRHLARLAIRTPELREYTERLILMLPPPYSDSRVLDVGCGDGRTVEALKSLGWDAEGVDFDARAVEAARARGLAVKLGSLEAQHYPDAHFDAVGMSHVIEHVPDPAATLREVRRVLRPGGRLILATPNALSLGHRRFQRDWRGLEPPRHLHVFTAESLRRVLAGAGLPEVSLTTSALGAAFASAEGRRIRGQESSTSDVEALAFAREETLALERDGWAGEELVLVATRDEIAGRSGS